MKELISRQMFKVVIGVKIVAREVFSAIRKDVIAKCQATTTHANRNSSANKETAKAHEAHWPDHTPTGRLPSYPKNRRVAI